MEDERQPTEAAADATATVVPEHERATPPVEPKSPPVAVRSATTKPRRKGPRPKHVPQRMCVACRERDAKRTLTRIVRTPDGQVAIDPTGRQNGRGAYLCDNPGCWEKAVRGGLLTRALNISLPAEAIETLRHHATTLRVVQQAEQAQRASSERAAPAGS